MNILLIEPPAVSKFGNQRMWGANGSNKSDFRKPPLDLMMISGYLRKNGFDNTLFDANSSRRTIEDVKIIIREISPSVIFFSTSTCTIYKDLLIAKAAKEINQSIITVAIGTHVMALPTETFSESNNLDVIVYSDEWEQVALNIVKNISHLEFAKGIFFRKADGNILKTRPEAWMENLDDLGFPSHDKLEKYLYKDPIAKRFPKTKVMGQKGCINNCSFCCQPAFFGAPTLRKRSIGHFLEELQWVQRLGFQEVMFTDPTLTADIDWACSLFEGMLEKGIDFTWNCSTRADRITPHLLTLMKKAGCYNIALGMESVDSVVLKNIRKNISPDQVRKAVSLIRRQGIDTVVFCVLGFPGETQESIKKTLSFLKTLDTTFITLGIAVPVPGTDFYKYVNDNNYLYTKDWSLYDPLKKPVFNYPNLSASDIAYYSNYGLRQFYLRPSYIIERLKSIRNYSDLLRYFSNFIEFINRYVYGDNMKYRR